jgi:hypothetical protein
MARMVGVVSARADSAAILGLERPNLLVIQNVRSANRGAGHGIEDAPLGNRSSS